MKKTKGQYPAPLKAIDVISNTGVTYEAGLKGAARDKALAIEAKGFGELADNDEHPVYKDVNFEASYEKVDSRVKRTAKGMDYQLIKGFFSETLALGAESYGIKKSKIIFIDSDTYASAIDALLFVLPTIQEGSYIILDDYFAYKGNQSHGVARAFTEFIDQGKLSVRHVLNYGMGGVAFVISGMK